MLRRLSVPAAVFALVAGLFTTVRATGAEVSIFADARLEEGAGHDGGVTASP